MEHKSRFTRSHSWINHLWGIILAGGDGIRLQHFVQTQFGVSRPKQYCALIGKRSMLRHTIDRVKHLIPDTHLLTTIGNHHLSYAIDDLQDRMPETVIVQPLNRETGPGILLPLLHIHHADPEAIVALFPSDHFILEEDRYMEHVRAAIDFVSSQRDSLVMLGARPTTLQQGYGWIEQGNIIAAEGGMNMFSVQKFWEKPDGQLTRYLHEKKCLWNTMILIGTSSMLTGLFKEFMEEIFVPFHHIWTAIETPQEFEITEKVFATIPSVNFSHTILERIPERLSVLPMKGIYWNDWGDESRVRADIDYFVQNHGTFSDIESLIETT